MLVPLSVNLSDADFWNSGGSLTGVFKGLGREKGILPFFKDFLKLY